MISLYDTNSGENDESALDACTRSEGGSSHTCTRIGGYSTNLSQYFLEMTIHNYLGDVVMKYGAPLKNRLTDRMHASNDKLGLDRCCK